MQPQLVAWVRARPLWVCAAVGVLVALTVVYLLPLILVPEAGLDAEKRLNAENDLRTTLVQAIGGAVLLFGTWRTLHINREGQITERFTRAIDQLGQTGKEKLDVRLGGIYALERIAKESDTDRGPIIEVLTAFLRERARWNPDDADTPAVTGRSEAGLGKEQRSRLRADFQAVATVIGRNQWSQEQDRVDLREVDLRTANLAGAHLEGAILFSAHLERAIFAGAHLKGALLASAHLEGGFLFDAHLERANLAGAHLERANLGGAHLEGANLAGAHLEGAYLGDAYLEGIRGLTPAQVERVIGLSEAIGVPPGLLRT